MGWNSMNELSATDFEINRHIERLDQVTTDFEARWGCDVLPGLVSKDLTDKWHRQCERLNEAIQTKNLQNVADLTAGCIRGFKMLEDAAVAAGHAPRNPDCWDMVHPDSGRVYRFAKNINDARAAQEKGVYVYTLEEVVRILEANDMINKVKGKFPEAVVDRVVPSAFDFNAGDSVEF